MLRSSPSLVPTLGPSSRLPSSGNFSRVPPSTQVDLATRRCTTLNGEEVWRPTTRAPRRRVLGEQRTLPSRQFPTLVAL